MAKNNRSGQAKILTDLELSRIKKQLRTERDRLLFEILRYTGERIGAVIQLRQSDCYGRNGEPRDQITFRAATRKADARGRRATRQVPAHPLLMDALAVYTLPDSDWLFPSKTTDSHVSRARMDLILRQACDRAGLGGSGISTHSFRRTLITRLDEKGVSVRTIQAVTGHKSLMSVQRYIEVSDERVKGAISLL